MNCDEFQMMLADALGDELREQDQPAFEAHLKTCDRCRDEYESSVATVKTLRDIPGPTRVTVRREGDRLVIVDKAASSQASHKFPKWGGMRLAASILIAFTAGYAFHASNLLRPGNPLHDANPVSVVVTDSEAEIPFRAALASVYQSNRTRSDLANCMIAMFGKK